MSLSKKVLESHGVTGTNLKESDSDIVKKYSIRFESQLYGATEKEFNKFIDSLKLDKLPADKAEAEKENLTKAWKLLNESVDPKQMAHTVLDQLGGRKFIAMTGAKDFSYGENKGAPYMTFKIPRNASSANYVRIKLNGKDLYDVEFLKVSVKDIKPVKSFNDIYADGLAELFTEVTGMYTSLGTMGRQHEGHTVNSEMVSKIEKMNPEDFSDLTNLQKRYDLEIFQQAFANWLYGQKISYKNVVGAFKAMMKDHGVDTSSGGAVLVSGYELKDVLYNKKQTGKPVSEAKEFDLGAGHLGNGITVWNRAKEVHGDYETVAHIDQNRKIKWYIKNPPEEVVAYVDGIAKGKNMAVSTTQKDQKVFSESSDEYIAVEYPATVRLDTEVYQALTGVKPDQAKDLKVTIVDEMKHAGGFESLIILYKRSYAYVSADTRYEGVYAFADIKNMHKVFKDVSVNISRFVNPKKAVSESLKPLSKILKTPSKEDLADFDQLDSTEVSILKNVLELNSAAEFDLKTLSGYLNFGGLKIKFEKGSENWYFTLPELYGKDIDKDGWKDVVDSFEKLRSVFGNWGGFGKLKESFDRLLNEESWEKGIKFGDGLTKDQAFEISKEVNQNPNWSELKFFARPEIQDGKSFHNARAGETEIWSILVRYENSDFDTAVKQNKVRKEVASFLNKEIKKAHGVGESYNMKNKKLVESSRDQIKDVSSGTVATLIGLADYKNIDKFKLIATNWQKDKDFNSWQDAYKQMMSDYGLETDKAGKYTGDKNKLIKFLDKEADVASKSLFKESFITENFGKKDKWNYAVKLNGVDPKFYEKGHDRDALLKIRDFQEQAKKYHVGAKGKATLSAVKNWVKENKPTEFYAKWGQDSSYYKDDVVQIYAKGVKEFDGSDNKEESLAAKVLEAYTVSEGAGAGVTVSLDCSIKFAVEDGVVKFEPVMADVTFKSYDKTVNSADNYGAGLKLTFEDITEQELVDEWQHEFGDKGSVNIDSYKSVLDPEYDFRRELVLSKGWTRAKYEKGDSFDFGVEADRYGNNIIKGTATFNENGEYAWQDLDSYDDEVEESLSEESKVSKSWTFSDGTNISIVNEGSTGEYGRVILSLYQDGKKVAETFAEGAMSQAHYLVDQLLKKKNLKPEKLVDEIKGLYVDLVRQEDGSLVILLEDFDSKVADVLPKLKKLPLYSSVVESEENVDHAETFTEVYPISRLDSKKKRTPPFVKLHLKSNSYKKIRESFSSKKDSSLIKKSSEAELLNKLNAFNNVLISKVEKPDYTIVAVKGTNFAMDGVEKYLKENDVPFEKAMNGTISLFIDKKYNESSIEEATKLSNADKKVVDSLNANIAAVKMRLKKENVSASEKAQVEKAVKSFKDKKAKIYAKYKNNESYLDTLTLWYFDGKYYKALNSEPKKAISKEEFYKTIKDLDMDRHDSKTTGMTTYSKSVKKGSVSESLSESSRAEKISGAKESVREAEARLRNAEEKLKAAKERKDDKDIKFWQDRVASHKEAIEIAKEHLALVSKPAVFGESWGRALNPMTADTIVADTAKLIKSKAWAKKNKEKFRHPMTTAGDNIGYSAKEDQDAEFARIRSGAGRVISKKGLENLKRGIKSILMNSVGLNIAEQALAKLSNDDLLKVANNIVNEFDIRGFDSIEESYSKKVLEAYADIESVNGKKVLKTDEPLLAKMDIQKEFENAPIYDIQAAISKAVKSVSGFSTSTLYNLSNVFTQDQLNWLYDLATSKLDSLQRGSKEFRDWQMFDDEIFIALAGAE